MIKLTKTQEGKLDCICSICNHDCMDKACLDNKIMDAKEPGEEMKKQILLLMDDILKKNLSATRVKIGKKKG